MLKNSRKLATRSHGVSLHTTSCLQARIVLCCWSRHYHAHSTVTPSETRRMGAWRRLHTDEPSAKTRKMQDGVPNTNATCVYCMGFRGLAVPLWVTKSKGSLHPTSQALLVNTENRNSVQKYGTLLRLIADSENCWCSQARKVFLTSSHTGRSRGRSYIM